MTSPVGIFDSGLGGLSVAARILDTLPNEQVLYFADNAHVPYGEKPLEMIRSFAVEITRFLIERGAKAVVMACNMSSAVALDAARERFPSIPIIGMIEPGARAAVKSCGGRPIGVLATTGTIASGAYDRAVRGLDESLRVVGQACPRFVPLVESGRAGSEEAEAAARDYVAPLTHGGCSTIILGCTHYPFLRGAIEAAAGPCMSVVDPAEEVARALREALEERRLASDALRAPHVFLASGETEDFAALGSAFLGRPIGAVERVEWGMDIGLEVRSRSKHI